MCFVMSTTARPYSTGPFSTALTIDTKLACLPPYQTRTETMFTHGGEGNIECVPSSL